MKAILVVDIPDDFKFKYKTCDVVLEAYADITLFDGKNKMWKREEVEVKPMPQKRKIENYMECWQRHYIAGINDTISRIEGTLIQTHSED